MCRDAGFFLVVHGKFDKHLIYPICYQSLTHHTLQPALVHVAQALPCRQHRLKYILLPGIFIDLQRLLTLSILTLFSTAKFTIIGYIFVEDNNSCVTECASCAAVSATFLYSTFVSHNTSNTISRLLSRQYIGDSDMDFFGRDALR